MELTEEQFSVCRRYGAVPVSVGLQQKAGISRNALQGMWPIYALRHVPEGDTCGWYIWAGEELDENPDFFALLHVEHLASIIPDIIKYLGLAPGWRVLINQSGYEDVWQDEELLLT